MQRRVLAAIAAVALAAVGAVLLISYVGGADDRARADEATVQVLVAQADIPVGTPANQLTAKVTVEEVPVRLVTDPENALTDLAELGERRTATAMLAGDQLSAARFSEATAKARDDGLEQVSLTLDAQRAVGGNLSEGDRVAVYRTQTVDGVSQTQRLYDDVPVTRVGDLDGSGASGGAVTVTLALTEDQASTVVAGMYDGAVWLSLVDAATDKGNN
jgi:pilus assembly protein CpaB